MQFKDLDLNESLQKAISAIGYETPTPIQEKVIPQILSDNSDLIGLAETGSGKTAAFGLPMLNKIDMDDRRTQGLILAPTRELCMQIAREMENFAKYSKGIVMTPVYGGAPFPPQIKALKRGTHTIIATPGRLLDLIKKGIADLSSLRFLVLDEADVMLNMGFKDELDSILEAAPDDRQSLLLSATMPPEVARIAKEYMTDPVEITAGTKNKASANITHSCFMVHAKDKYKALKRLVDAHPGVYGIIFCRTRASCQVIADKMIKEGYSTDALHGDLSQNQREYVMKKFRDRSLQLLVATDIAARGLDVNSLTHVIHYDLPDEIEIYNHRSGRTGRAGNKGHSYAIINMREKYRIRKIENIIGRKISYEQIPSGRAICEAQLMSMIDKVKKVKVDQAEIATYMPVIEEKLSDMSREDLLHQFVSLEFNRFLDYYGKEKDLTSPTQRNDREPRSDRGPRRDRGPRSERKRSEDSGFRPSSGQLTPLSISVGKRDNVLPPQIIGLINQNTQGEKIPLGKINIGPTSTIVYVDGGAAENLMNSMKRATFKGRRLKVKLLSDRPSQKHSNRDKSGKKKGYAGKKQRKPE